MTNQPQKRGEAYAFFKGDYPLNRVLDYLPQIRENASTPTKLELKLTEGVNPEIYDGELRAIAEDADYMGMNYTIEAKYEGATNNQTADEVADILNATYQSPLYPDKSEKLRGTVCYKDKGKYKFRN